MRKEQNSSTAKQSNIVRLPKSGPYAGADSIPSDIWYQIFAAGTFEGTERDRITFPLLISSVSTVWRKFALQSPLLWSTIISRTPDMHTPAPNMNYVELIAIFLERSVETPLNVDLDFCAVNGDLAAPDIIPDRDVGVDATIYSGMVVDKILNHAHRIKSLKITAFNEVGVAYIPSRILQKAMPQLETLRFIKTGITGRRQWGGPLDVTDSTAAIDHLPYFGTPDAYPLLKIVDISGFHTNWDCWSVGGLTSLTLTELPSNVRPSWEAWRTILRANSQSLVHLHIRGIILADTILPETIPEAIELSHVRELYVGFNRPPELETFFCMFHFPAMKSLTIEDIIAMDRFGGDFDGTIEVLGHMTTGKQWSHVPYGQIEYLKLLHVLIWSPPHDNSLPDAQAAQVGVARSFLMRFSCLKTLVLHAPGDIILEVFNTPNVASDSNGLSTATFVFPALKSLRIECVRPDTLTSFVFRRIANATGQFRELVPVLDELVLCRAARWRKKEESLSTSPEFSTVIRARKVFFRYLHYCYY